MPAAASGCLPPQLFLRSWGQRDGSPFVMDVRPHFFQYLHLTQMASVDGEDRIPFISNYIHCGLRVIYDVAHFILNQINWVGPPGPSF